MKFMVTWRLHPDKRDAAIEGFARMTAEDDKRDMGENIKLIGRWHDMSEGTGVAICESDDPLAMATWALHWSTVLDLQTRVVLDDQEARAVGKKRIEELENLKATVIQN